MNEMDPLLMAPMPLLAEPSAPAVDPIAQQEAAAAELERKQKLAAEVRDHYAKSRQQRKKHEGNWFRNGAFLRGNEHVEYNEAQAKLVTPEIPSYRVRLDLNRIRPKIRARNSKFFKARPRPVVIPASTSHTDILNARGTEKVLAYQWDRLRLEEKYKDARLWASIGAKAYWWFSIDPSAPARIGLEDGTQETLENAGDVQIEVGSPFEVLVADPAIMRLGDQPWIQRVRMLGREDAIERFPEIADKLRENSSGDTATLTSSQRADRISQYPDRLATLRQNGGAGTSDIDRKAEVLMIEEFMAPCAKYPKGRYVVVVENELAREESELPYGMWEHKSNPYPCVDFTDALTPGQFWGTTFVEQLIDVQRQFNYLFELLTENARMCARPKIVIYRQHNLADGAWTNAPGEIVELTYVPGLPAPIILQAQNISGDIWNLINFYDRMFDEITQIYPAAEGQVAASTSGFQTNLLQEATDTVHAPDVREDELTLQDAAWKIRRLSKLAYKIPRLITIGGENSLPEMLEFGAHQIDEYAEVRIQAGSMLPDMKAARNQTAMELHKSGLFGDPADPIVRRRVLNMMDMGGLEVVNEEDRIDLDQASLEQQKLSKGMPVRPAEFNQDHLVHITKHQTFMKSPAFESLAPEAKQAITAHVISHYDWVNPVMAQGLRQLYGLLGLPVATPPPAAPPVPPGTEQAPSAPAAPSPQAPPQ